jgi:carboxymethylenebutenolidase
MPEVTIKTADGEFSAYLARPRRQGDGGRAPGMVVIQEIFGVNAGMRAICDDYAAQGYLAICPDLFWRQQPGVQLTDRTEGEWAQAFGFFKGFHEAKGIDDLRTTLETLRVDEGCSGVVGCVGYCLGGRLAYLMATRTAVDCSVGYYGVGIENNLNEAAAITKPLMLHIAEEDEYCSKAAQEQIKQVLANRPRVTLHSYPGVGHAFARVGGQHWDAKSAELANERSAAFFKKHLQ